VKITGNTAVCGIFGYPVKHSFSPRMHNAAFARYGLDFIYVPFEVSPAMLKKAVDGIRSMNLKGVNVTIPHKVAVIRYIDWLSPEAEATGAVNTLVNENGVIKGYNTDGAGFIESLERDLGFRPAGKSVFLLGAGGAGRAVSSSLVLRGASVICITDAEDKRARGLIKELRKIKGSAELVFVAAADEKNKRELLLSSQLLVNASPVGMKKGEVPLDPACLHRGLKLYDVIYNPLKTQLMAAAARKGIKTVNGLGMLIRQGMLSFNLWTGVMPDYEVMKKGLKLR